MSGSGGGRRAVLPPAAWHPLVHGVAASAPMIAIFVPEAGGPPREFDFSGFNLTDAMRCWLARVFAAHCCGPRSGVKRTKTAAHHWAVLKLFAESLSRLRRPPRRPGEVAAAHLAAFLLPYRGKCSHHEYRKQLRTLLGGDRELSSEFKLALAPDRDSRVPSQPVTPYSDDEWQQIMVVLRHEIAAARTRIHAARELLDRFRAGAPIQDTFDVLRAQTLDVFDRTGDLPRNRRGDVTRPIRRVGGVRGVGEQLCLTSREATAFCLLLTMLTGQNLGTVAQWPAVTHRPDGGTGPGVALIEAVKPRRGPDRQHMITPLEDVPDELADLLTGQQDDLPLFRSPLRVYLLLLDLNELARRHGGHATAFACFTSAAGQVGSYWSADLGGQPMRKWTRHHRLDVRVGRVRQTVIERRREPIANTHTTARDVYLLPSTTVAADSRQVVTAALQEQVAKARALPPVQLIRSDDPDTAASAAGLDPQVMHALNTGEHDTVATACIDNRHGPHSASGIPCQASFLACLSCPNARALPHHLPVQIGLRDRLRDLRPHLHPQVWQHRYAEPFGQLGEIINQYTQAEQDRAGQSIAEPQSALIDALVGGRLDIR